MDSSWFKVSYGLLFLIWELLFDMLFSDTGF